VIAGADIASGLARGLSMAGVMAVFGTALLRGAVARPPLAGSPERVRRRAERRLAFLALAGLILAIVAGIAWLLLETANLAPDDSVQAQFATLPIVLWQTRFGWLLQIRLGLLLTGYLLGLWHGGVPARSAASLFSGIAIGLQAGLGHGVSMGGSLGTVLSVTEALHLLSAAAWLGALPGLFLLLGTLEPGPARAVASRFSHFGAVCVVVLTVTIAIQGWELMGGLPGLIGTDYGRLALIKLALLLLLLALAALNRFRLAPAIGRAGPRRLRLSVALETGVGLAAVIAAGILLTQQPAMHVQPDWPFAWRLSSNVMAEDELRPIVLEGIFEGLIALLALAAAIAWRRLRWPGLALALLMIWIAAPNLRLLLVPAYPTSFYRSPTGFTSASIVHGAGLYANNCTPCHGVGGRGDGALAKSLAIPPADLTAAHLFGHSDGELFWWLGHGIKAPDGSVAMPGFAGTLDEDQRWNLIDYIRARNAGLAVADGELTRPLRAPDATVTVGGTTQSLSALRGRWLRMVALGSGFTEPPPLAAVTTLTIASGSDAWSAYAIASGISPDEMAGSEFLVDPEGWLRDVFRPLQPGIWPDETAFAAARKKAAENPIADTGGSMAGMPME
jgi:putative copper export protein/mono/diheme cytochrome c family protein